jgi:hypothetical protein
MDDLDAYRKKTGKDSHTIFADPLLSSESTLRPGSPGIDAGIDVGYPYSGTAPDLGACEVASGSDKQRGIRK